MSKALFSAMVEEIFPTLNEEELQEAEFNLRRYLSLVIEIVERQQQQHVVDNGFDVSLAKR